MTALMIYAGPAAEDAPGTRIGGLPLVPQGFEWPECGICAGNMGFIVQVRQDSGYLSIFMCLNAPGLCDEWDVEAGGNRGFVWPADGLTVAKPPTTGEIRLPEVSEVTFTEFEDRNYNEARAAWPDARDVLGQLGGDPEPLQGDGTPRCSDCGEPMRFVVQLEEGQDHAVSANFGGGSAYGFACRTHPVAAFLW
jgi:hypothetical protein